MGLRYVASQREHHGDGVLGGRDRVAGRSVHHGYAAARGRFNVDVVDAHSGAPDDLEPAASVDDLRRNPGLTAHHQRVVLADDEQQILRRHSELHVHVTLGTQKLQPFRGQRVRNQHPGHQAPLAGEVTGWKPTCGSTVESALRTCVMSSSVM